MCACSSLSKAAFQTRYTDAHGIIRWNRIPRPIFALAQFGNSFAFSSFLPQAPLPGTIVGVRTDTAVVHAGGIVRVAGFARTRSGGALRPAAGSATIAMRLGGTLLAQVQAPVDKAGAFTAEIPIPAGATAGDYAVLAQVDGGVGGATVHVDADANGLSIDVASGCDGPCNSANDVPVTITSSRGNVAVRVQIVRSPHVYVGYTPQDAPWGTSVWLDKTVETNADGRASVLIAHPTDGLPSTYGVRADAGGASAVTRIVVPTARGAVRIALDRAAQTLGTPINFDVYGNDINSGRPLAGAHVTVALQHGPSSQQQELTLDYDGHAHGAFSAPSLGTNLVFATLTVDGASASDAAQVDIVPQATQDTSLNGSANVRIALDHTVYRAGDTVQISAALDGAQGDALLTIESANGTQTIVVPVQGGRATASPRIADATGDLRIGAAFVRAGAIAWTSVPLALDAPGRPVSATIAMPTGSFAPGAPVNVSLRDVAPGAGTTIVRISRGAPSGGALFESAPTLLAVGLAATQVSAPEGRTWHPWVDSTGEHAQVIGFERRGSPAAKSCTRAGRYASGIVERRTIRRRKHCSPDAERARPLYALDPHDRRRRAGDRGLVADYGAVMPRKKPSRLMLLDTYGLVYRAFFALPPLTTVKGIPINAVYGFTMMLNKVINDEKPTHVIAAFDKGMSVDRVALYKDYKAQRDAMPDDLRGQFQLVRDVLAVHRIPVVEIEGQEADDVIATLARQAEAAGEETLVVTGDLDLLQIVDDRTTVLTTRRGITDLGRYDPAAVYERFELQPNQLADYRGLKGDPSDNLPGIPGVGEKTAIKLIKAAGSLDALIADPSVAGTPKLQKLVEDYGEQARVCRDVSIVRTRSAARDRLGAALREAERCGPLSALRATRIQDVARTSEGAGRRFTALCCRPQTRRQLSHVRRLGRSAGVCALGRGVACACRSGTPCPRGARGRDRGQRSTRHRHGASRRVRSHTTTCAKR